MLKWKWTLHSWVWWEYLRKRKRFWILLREEVDKWAENNIILTSYTFAAIVNWYNITSNTVDCLRHKILNIGGLSEAKYYFKTYFVGFIVFELIRYVSDIRGCPIWYSYDEQKLLRIFSPSRLHISFVKPSISLTRRLNRRWTLNFPPLQMRH
jgi:hypothetical protein